MKNNKYNYLVANTFKTKYFFQRLFFTAFSCLLFTRVVTAQTVSVSRFELVATDANNLNATGTYNGGSVTVANSWGNHQPRITKTNDGTVYILYLNLDNSNKGQWRLMKRGNTGTWSQEAVGPTGADAYLLHNPITDELTVVGWSDNPAVPAYWTSPFYTKKAVPGSWVDSGYGGQPYGGCGISPDGTICVKKNGDVKTSPGNPYTSSSHILYNCGKSNGSSIVWGNYQDFYAGPRHAYDYIFPSTTTPAGVGVLATNTRDLYKDAEPMPNSSNDYIFNGGKMWWSVPTASTPQLQSSVIIPPILAPGATEPPTQRISDSYLDNTGRVFTTYYLENPANTSSNGIYLTVANASTGSTFFTGKLVLPNYGYCRIYQDAGNNLWTLWTNEGSQQTQVWLFPLLQSGTGNTATFTVGTKYDLSSSFAPYVIVKYPYLAVPRSGAVKDYVIDGIMGACTNSYPQNSGWSCYGSGNSGKEKIFYFRINLPNVATDITNEMQRITHTLNVYPNPNNSYIEIHTDLSTIKELDIIIYDVLGKEIAAKTINMYNNRIETSNLPNGIYFIKGQKENTVYTQKFLVQH